MFIGLQCLATTHLFSVVNDLVVNSTYLYTDRPRTMDQKQDSVPCQENGPTGPWRVPTDSPQTAKDIEILKQYVQFRPALSQEPQLTPDGHVIIDPAVREKIANPEYPVRMPDKPFENLSFYDYTANAGKASSNISKLDGLFGRKWRKRLEKQQERQYAEEDAKSEEDVRDIRDDTCPMFMIRGICRWGDRCPLRHPPYRYLQCPKRTAPPDPEPVDTERKARDPNSYAAILEKSRTKKEFFNDAVSKVCGTTKETFSEEWPALGSPGQGSCNTMIAPKAWGPKRDAPTVPQVWEPLSTTKKAVRNSTINQLQIANDELIADNLQAEEYSQLSEYDGNEADYEEDYNYYPEQGLNEDEYIEEIEEEELNSTYSNPVIMEQNSDGESDEPVQPKIIISNVCDICLDRPKDATLVCGHRYCYQCALQMRLDERVCAICRRCIISVIKTYN